MNLTPRAVFLFGLIASISMIAFAISYFQLYLELEPCPLCILQRIGMFSVTTVFLIATLHNPKRAGVVAYSILGFIIAMAGGGVSVRHLWLQNLPKDAIPECSPGYDYIVNNFPLMDAIPLLLNGSGECSETLWSLFGISIPGWTLVGFLFLGLLSLSQLWNKKTS
jgi:disulfide bond formation protein DsbB